MLVTFIAGAAALSLLLKYRSAIVAKFKGEVSVVAEKVTAFARLAEQEGKVVALKAANAANAANAAAAKAAEAKAIHAAQDEFDKLIG